jgi:NAD(P)-dependent dehydrogenase (short-subunit alcohol dehydrogenase family)
MMKDLRGQHIWIIGASTGIGAALAENLAAHGALVAVSARDEAGLKALVSRLPGVGHHAMPMDVTDIASFKQAATALRQSWPRIDIIIYNAGTYQQMSVRSFDLAAANRMLDVNLRGAFNMLDAVLPILKSQHGGHLVLVSSVAAYRGLPNALGYSASKAALFSLAESLAIELASWKVKVQVICPGFVKTRLVEKNKFPMPFIMTPQQAADAMMKGITSNAFEINFPKRFTWPLKFLCSWPHALYFWVMRQVFK